MQKTVVFRTVAPSRSDFVTGDREYDFGFYAVDSSLVGEPEEVASARHHKIKVGITWELLINWRLSKASEEDLIKVLFHYGRRRVEERIKNGTLREHEELCLSMEDHPESYCPLDLSRIPNPIGFVLKIDTDLPLRDRLYVDEIDSFQKVRDVNRAMVASFLSNDFLDRTEDQVQRALEQILDVSFHKKDWGGEINDLYTANVVVNGARRATAFLLKGPGIGKKEMAISDCGIKGDQLVRLFTTPADLFVVQYVGPISEMLVRDVQGKVAEQRARALGQAASFLVMDGQETARVLYAYGKL